MGKYLKMTDVFDFPVKPRHVHDENGYGFKLMLFHSLQAECAAHAIDSHDELVENVLHYEADALMWERRAVTEASRAQELVAEVERLTQSLNHANSNHELFERQYYLEKDKCEDLQAEVERLRGELKSVTNQLMEADQMVQEMQGIIDNK